MMNEKGRYVLQNLTQFGLEFAKHFPFRWGFREKFCYLNTMHFLFEEHWTGKSHLQYPIFNNDDYTILSTQGLQTYPWIYDDI